MSTIERTIMSASVFDRIHEKLTAAGITFGVLRHAPVYTSEEAAAVRGVPLCTGAKALIVKAGEDFVLLVVPADRKLDSKKARTALGVKGLRFANREEVLELTGLLPGSIPPFGSLFGLPTFCDPALRENDQINFNAGDHAVSVSMTCADYVAVEKPTLAELT
jgi:Ala-tRNA(Pro) deacylase